jgi:flagellar hook-basal body complex protein FliE
MRIGQLLENTNMPSTEKKAAGTQPGEKSFGETLTKAIEKVNDLQTESDNLAVKVAGGDLDNIHQAMISMEKASLALEFALQIRNKAIEAYQELMKTQV